MSDKKNGQCAIRTSLPPFCVSEDKQDNRETHRERETQREMARERPIEEGACRKLRCVTTSEGVDVSTKTVLMRKQVLP